MEEEEAITLIISVGLLLLLILAVQDYYEADYADGLFTCFVGLMVALYMPHKKERK